MYLNPSHTVWILPHPIPLKLISNKYTYISIFPATISLITTIVAIITIITITFVVSAIISTVARIRARTRAIMGVGTISIMSAISITLWTSRTRIWAGARAGNRMATGVTSRTISITWYTSWTGAWTWAWAWTGAWTGMRATFTSRYNLHKISMIVLR